MTSSERVRCCVPFCGRSTKLECTEWICAEHWRAVPREERDVYSRVKRKMRRAGQQWNEAAGRIWARCKRIAIERAAGL